MEEFNTHFKPNATFDVLTDYPKKLEVSRTQRGRGALPQVNGLKKTTHIVYSSRTEGRREETMSGGELGCMPECKHHQVRCQGRYAHTKLSQCIVDRAHTAYNQ